MGKMVVDERIHETSLITGIGDYTLLGAVTGKQPVSVIGANNYFSGYAEDGTNWEAAFYTYVTGPGRVQRTHVFASSNGGAPVNWNNATVNIRADLPAWLAFPRLVSKSVAGSSDVTLTAPEQRCHILILTGALTGDINVIVDTTPWKWIVVNNTSGSYTPKVKTSAGTGILVRQGTTRELFCDGTNVAVAAAGSAIGTLSRDSSLASGTQAVTGVGFKPTRVRIQAAINATMMFSFGVSDGTINSCIARAATSSAGTTEYTGANGQNPTNAIFIRMGVGDYYAGTIAMDDDGFTITWTKSGATSGSIDMAYVAER